MQNQGESRKPKTTYCDVCKQVTQYVFFVVWPGEARIGSQDLELWNCSNCGATKTPDYLAENSR